MPRLNENQPSFLTSSNGILGLLREDTEAPTIPWNSWCIHSIVIIGLIIPSCCRYFKCDFQTEKVSSYSTHSLSCAWC